ncbi:hypothetical protein B0H14DRAFT_2460648 [Mycena olivaceomarginata]|nr:hypothetical protein B0H14DRAFT_2460648 [Mycena olivaceomarginata]
MSSPSAKGGPTENAPITRSETWMSDGNVILQVGNKQFRVHWSVLALHSHVFRDMQGLPQPEDQPIVDGCPVVELFDDPVDVEYLLKVLYTPTFLSRKVLPLPAVGALIRLGRKYGFKDLWDSAVGRLTSQCPTTLEAYDSFSRIFEYYNALDFDIVALASENKILSALPCAYYRLLDDSPLQYLFDEIQRPDGTIARLSGPNLQTCVKARERLLAKQFRDGYTLGWARQWEFYDCQKALCRTARESILKRYLLAAEMGALERPNVVSGGFHNLCPTCSKHAIESTTAGRKKTWEESPQVFDLSVWNELKNDI